MRNLTEEQGHKQGGSDSSDEPPFSEVEMFKMKIYSKLTALELSASYLHTGTALR